MRHSYKGRKLGSSHGHTKAMKVGLVQALFLNDRIKTTQARAKEIRGDVDRIITWAKKGDLHSRRLAIAALGNNKELVREIFEKVQQGMFKDRPGGYTRIMKLGPRKGDGAPMVIMELVTENCIPKAERDKKASASKAQPKKAAPKKTAKKEKADEGKHESVIEEIRDSIEAAEEEAAKEIREDGEQQLAEERAEAAKDDAEEAEKAARKEDAEAAEAAAEKKLEKENEAAEEKIREEQMKAEEKAAKNAEAEEPNPAEMPESEEHAK